MQLTRTPLRRLLASSFLLSLGLILLISNGLNYFALKNVLWINSLVRLEDRLHSTFQDLEPRLQVEESPEKVHRIWENPVRVAPDFAEHLPELARMLGSQRQFQAAILDRDGKVLNRFPEKDGTCGVSVSFAELERLRVKTELALQHPEGHYALRLHYPEGRDHQVVVAPLVDINNQLVGYAWLRGSWKLGQNALRNYAEWTLVTLLLMVAVTISLSFWLAGVWTRPLERLAVSAHRVARGDLSARTQLEGGGNEVYEVAQAFDMMLDRIQALFDSQRLFLADASHELKTPITALSGLVQMMDLIEEKSPEPRRTRSLSLMGRELDRMERLVADLLTLSRAEQTKPSFSAVSVRELCDDALSSALVGAPDRKICRDITAAAPEMLLGDPDALVRALRNLLDNALHYTPPEGTIKLTCFVQGPDVVLQIQDSGCGIGQTHLAHLGERFYRADPSRARKSGGTGLGLAIVRAIMEQHGGRLEIFSEDGRGTRASLFIPRQQTV